MNETITYEWTEKLARSSLSAFDKDKVGRSLFILVGGAVLAIVGLIGFFLNRAQAPLIVGVMGVVLMGVSLKIRFQIRRLAKDAARLSMDDTKVSVIIADSSLTISSVQSSRIVEYCKLTHLKERDGFLLFYTGKLMVASLPTVAFDARLIAILKSKIG
jgi:uncharacterized integral membrane protein